MGDEARIVLVVMGIIFWVVRSILKSNKNKANKPVAKHQKTTTSSPKKSQNIDDIFKDFVQELEKKKKTSHKPAPVKRTVASRKTTPKKKSLDWQQVERTHIAPKKQLLNHDDYHGDPLATTPTIQESEGEVYSFDIDEIDFRDAIIAKEILDRKYA